MDKGRWIAKSLMISLAVTNLCTGTFISDRPCNEVKYCKRCPRQEPGGPAICTECYGFGLFVLDTEVYPPVCRKCMEYTGCLKCSSTSKCDLCAQPAINGPDMNGRCTCSRCADNCAYCGLRGGGKCDQCNPGYQLTDHGICSSCSNNCDTCRFGECLECSKGFYRSFKGDCEECPENCSTCFDKHFCLFCNDGYAPDKSNNCIKKSEISSESR